MPRPGSSRSKHKNCYHCALKSHYSYDLLFLIDQTMLGNSFGASILQS